MSKKLKPLKSEELLIIFTYSPAGLGHLRVTDALYHGLPEGVVPVLLGSDDDTIRFVHRITSIHPLLRRLFEWMQSEGPSELFTKYYRRRLRKRSKFMKEQLLTELKQRIKKPEKVLIVSTHFGLAHQAASVKDEIEKSEKVKIILATVVTDDSPQYIWYVAGSDYIFVPSHSTMHKLEHYAQENDLDDAQIIVNPYPINPFLGENLSKNELKNRMDQVFDRSKINISVPVSGAAVGLMYDEILFTALRRKNKKIVFHVVSKEAPYTNIYLNRIKKREYVKVYSSDSDRETVDLYDRLYKQNVISFEITKPSEQAFKAMLETSERGGVIMLFTKPVGRQEYDNLKFLRRHDLIPLEDENEMLWHLADERASVEDAQKTGILNKLTGWRGIVIPADPMRAANFIDWMFENKLFGHMFASNAEPNSSDRHPEEVTRHGVKRFWEFIASKL